MASDLQKRTNTIRWNHHFWHCLVVVNVVILLYLLLNVKTGAVSAGAGRVLRLAKFPGAEEQGTVPVTLRTPRYPNQWGLEAQRKLATWRSNLYKMTQAALVDNGNQQLHWKDWSKFLDQNKVDCPPGQSMTHFGPYNAGGKDLCAPWNKYNSTSAVPPCVVYSIGSHGFYEFETEMLKLTTCDVYTFDCTWDGKSLDPDRHHYFKLCLGSEAQAEKYINVISYRQMVELFKHDRVEVFKVDVETYEFDFFADLNEDLGEKLPDQIIVEWHYQPYSDGSFLIADPLKKKAPASLANPNMFHGREWNITTGRGITAQDIGWLHGHLANLGYAVAKFEEGYGCDCHENLYLKVETIKTTGSGEKTSS